MKQISPLLNGCIVIDNDSIPDTRGFFIKAFQDGEFVENTFVLRHVDEIFWTESKKGVARGLHLQLPPRPVSKFVMCTSGHILDMVLDLRIDSETYGKLGVVQLGPADGLSKGVFIPTGFAHGFITLSDFATVAYLQMGKFSPEHDTGVSLESVRSLIPGDITFELDLMSERDRSLPSFESFPKYNSKEWAKQSS